MSKLKIWKETLYVFGYIGPYASMYAEGGVFPFMKKIVWLHKMKFVEQNLQK
jgi:hypothetical protein